MPPAARIWIIAVILALLAGALALDGGVGVDPG